MHTDANKRGCPQCGHHTTWQDNDAANWNGGAMHVSHDYGFGEVDALAAVRLAETWARRSTKANESSLK